MNNTIITSNSKAKIEIGDSKQDIFYPQFKTKHWDNECNFSIRLIDDHIGSYTYEDGVVYWKGKDKRAKFYHVNDKQFEFEVIFDKKPSTNIVEMSISIKRLWFYKQPMKAKKNEFIPENVKGSYAVYHSGKNGTIKSDDSIKEYKTGKAFHIYRPEVIDKDGNKCWCNMDIDFKKNILSIKIPQWFIDSANYPVILDPTYGYSSIGASEFSVSADELLSLFIRTSGQTDKIYIYAKGSGNVSYYYYTIKEGGYLDNTSSVSLPGSYQWTKYELPSYFDIGDQNIHFAVKSDSSFQIKYDSQEKAGAYNINLTRRPDSNSPPFGDDDYYISSYDWSNRRISMYGEYFDYGAYFMNNEKICIDGTYRNMSLYETGNFEPVNNYWAEDQLFDSGSISVDQMPAIVALKMRDDNYIIVNGTRGSLTDHAIFPWSSVHSSKGFTYTSENTYVPPSDGQWPWDPPTPGISFKTDYAIFTNNVPTSPAYGMEIYTSDGDKIFTSSKKQMLVVGVYSLTQLPNYGNEDPSVMDPYYVNVDDADNNYFFIGSSNGYCIPLAIVGFNEIIMSNCSSSQGFYTLNVNVEYRRRVYICAMKKYSSKTLSYKWILKGVQKSDKYTEWLTYSGHGNCPDPSIALTHIPEDDTCGFGYGLNAYSLGNGILFEVKVVE